MPNPCRPVGKSSRDSQRLSRKSSAPPAPFVDDEFRALRTSSKHAAAAGELNGSFQEGGSSSSSAGALRLVVFDFDQTLSTVHVFKSLAGWGEDKGRRRGGGEGRAHRRPEPADDGEADEFAWPDGEADSLLLPRGRRDQGGVGTVNGGLLKVPKPYASSERGQMRRIAELDHVEPFRGAGFASWAFGGDARVVEVRALLESLKERNVELMICTKGLVGAVRRCLFDLGLLGFFDEIYGNVGAGTYGTTRYDETVNARPIGPDEEILLGRGCDAAWATKDKLIAQLMRRRRLRKEEACLVEDDPEEIRRADRVCRTVWVREARGITTEHCERLRRMAEPSATTLGGAAFRAVEALGANGRGPSPRPPLSFGFGVSDSARDGNSASGDVRKSAENLHRGPRARSPGGSRTTTPSETPRSAGCGTKSQGSSSSLFSAPQRIQAVGPSPAPQGPLLPLPPRPNVRIRAQHPAWGQSVQAQRASHGAWGGCFASSSLRSAVAAFSAMDDRPATADTEASGAEVSVGSDGVRRNEEIQPPHSVPLPPLVFNLDTKAVIDTVNWLCETVQQQQSVVAKLNQKVKVLQQDAKQQRDLARENMDNSDLRYALLEKATTRPQSREPSDQSSSQAAAGRAAGGGDVEQQVRKLELELENCLLQQKKTEQYIKHQEKQQQLREEAQDELLKMELSGLGREIASCMKEKDLEETKSMLAAKLECLETELKSELQVIGTEVKGTLHGQISDVQTSVKAITESYDKQLDLFAEKTESMKVQELEHHDQHKKAAAHLLGQMQSVAQAVGVEITPPEEPEDRAAPVPASGATVERSGASDAPSGTIGSASGAAGAVVSDRAGISDRGLPPGALPRPGSGDSNKVRKTQIERLERRLEKLETELGVSLEGGSASPTAASVGVVPQDPSRPDSTQSRRETKPPPLPTRVEKVEEIAAALKEEIGLVLPSEAAASREVGSSQSSRGDAGSVASRDVATASPGDSSAAATTRGATVRGPASTPPRDAGGTHSRDAASASRGDVPAAQAASQGSAPVTSAGGAAPASGAAAPRDDASANSGAADFGMAAADSGGGATGASTGAAPAASGGVASNGSAAAPAQGASKTKRPPTQQRSQRSIGGVEPTEQAGGGVAEVVVKAQAVRLDAIEEQLREMRAICGLAPIATSTEAIGEVAPSTVYAPAGALAKMDEAAANLAGRVPPRQESEAVSPRLAGMIASQEDATVALRNQVDELQGTVSRDVGDLDARVSDLESKIKLLQGGVGAALTTGAGAALTSVGAAPPGGAAAAHASVQQAQQGAPPAAASSAASADNNAGGGRQSRAKQASAPKLPSAPPPSSTGGQEEGDNAADNTLLLHAVVNEVQNLSKVSDEMRARFKELSNELNEVRSSIPTSTSGSSPPVAAPASPSGGVRLEAHATSPGNSAAAVQRAESAAEAASASAAAAEKLRQELEEILRAIEVPVATYAEPQGSSGNVIDAFLEADVLAEPVRGVRDVQGIPANEEEQAEDAAAYVERQMEIETRLSQLEEQLDAASGGEPESDIYSGLKMVVKDVRKCLQRCELLFQLPEIKVFVKNFRKSLQMNAVLHERWLGPDGGRRKSEENEVQAAGTGEPDHGKALSKGSPGARSAPDLRAANAKREAQRSSSKKGDGKRKPFRTVMDWTRPHTPLKLDPQFRGHNIPKEVAAAGPTASVAQTADRSPNLPPIGGR